MRKERSSSRDASSITTGDKMEINKTVSNPMLVGAMQLIKSDGKNTINLKIDSEKVNLTASNQMSLSFNEDVPVISYEGEPLEISCSGKYLQEAIKSIGSDEITIEFAGELKPMVVKKDGDNSLIQLISPVRTYR